MSETAIQTAPQRLYLCVSDEPEDYAAPFPKDLSEVTWAVDHCPVACGVGYIRSDLHNAELTRLRTALAASQQTVKVLGEAVAAFTNAANCTDYIGHLKGEYGKSGLDPKWCEETGTPLGYAIESAMRDVNADPDARRAVEGTP